MNTKKQEMHDKGEAERGKSCKENQRKREQEEKVKKIREIGRRNERGETTSGTVVQCVPITLTLTHETLLSRRDPSTTTPSHRDRDTEAEGNLTPNNQCKHGNEATTSRMVTSLIITSEHTTSGKIWLQIIQSQIITARIR